MAVIIPRPEQKKSAIWMNMTRPEHRQETWMNMTVITPRPEQRQ